MLKHRYIQQWRSSKKIPNLYILVDCNLYCQLELCFYIDKLVLAHVYIKAVNFNPAISFISELPQIPIMARRGKKGATALC